MYIVTKTVRLSNGGKRVKVIFNKNTKLTVGWDYGLTAPQNHGCALKQFKELHAPHFNQQFIGEFADEDDNATVGHWVSEDSWRV